MNTSPLSIIKFSLPPELEASAPPEARGLRRDQVRLMVSNYSADQIRHDRFYNLDKYLDAGDVIIINTSRTRNSALLASRADGTAAELLLSVHFDDDVCTVEVRTIDELGKTKHLEDAREGEVLKLPGGASAVLQAPYIS